MKIELETLSETVIRKQRHNARDFDILEIIIKEAKKTGVMHIHYYTGGRTMIEFEEKEKATSD